jgi:hypothetical protein
MRLSRAFPLGAAVAALAVGASGCGSSTGPNTVTMTQAEVAEVFAEMSDALSGTGISLDRMPTGTFAPARAANASAGTAETINVSASCSGGGTVGVSGSVNASGTTGASFDLTETASSCETVHFTVGGSVKISGSVTLTSSTTSFNENVKGSFSITRKSDGTTGNCAIDFTVNGSFGDASSSVTASGTICGVNASAVVTT